MPPREIPSTYALNAHETRIQRLEDEHSEIKTCVGETKVRVEVLDEKMDSQTEKLDRILDGLDKQGDRLTVLEGSQERRKSVFKWAAGVGATLFSAWLLVKLGLS